MKDRWQWIEETQDSFEADRPRMYENNQDLLTLAALAEGESSELSHAIVDYMIEPTILNKEEVAGELADVFLYCLQLARLIGINFFEAIRDKRAYNTARFASREFVNGKPFEQGYNDSREWVKVRNFKQQYLNAQSNVIFQQPSGV
jgi:NTP pyrophosphatase (non-canonical NTP hydrolase)